MFEDFSFSSPSSRPARLAVDTDDRLMVDCDSSLISPMSSRCPSPSHRFRTLSRSRSSYFRSQQPPPTSVPFPYEQKRLSISTLTQKLHEHTLQGPKGERLPEQGRLTHDGIRVRNRYSGYVLTPPDTDLDEDGHYDSSPSLGSNPSPTSIPPDFPSLDNFDTPNFNPNQPDHRNIRMQRQQISQLQCDEGELDAIRRTVMPEEPYGPGPDVPVEDDCHPSSLPPRSSPRRRALTLHRSRFGPDSYAAEARGRRKSTAGPAQSHRIEKNHYPSHTGREASKRGDQGLRRQSMVSAALASVVERS
ncbi:hypothetical protein N7448_004576 [Penicillium atrosanguineum]|uniref:Uncharacterized protein n=1 Tax=Penicillium atrosanguineum TaxID=1132637 RepID=A0A9W9L4R4_9EURO|nr:uncharacterized protein N7443_008325 [Penicillium atrosanguineum]KAJ5136022.1 hypothetical protein N7448_004576 [Penicillium atrosanguineum]KAJ5292372.1 hypothetical protein N7443_008325 [Penicillium atrosanguineum]KAJ5303604.1 hypothetical protein N7476_010403 [Penicillium atrosanguineum]